MALVLVSRGESAAFATGWAVLSSLGQPIVAVPAFLFVEKFARVQVRVRRPRGGSPDAAGSLALVLALALAALALLCLYLRLLSSLPLPKLTSLAPRRR